MVVGINSFWASSKRKCSATGAVMVPAAQKYDGFDEKTFPRDGGGCSVVPVGWSRRIASQRQPTGREQSHIIIICIRCTLRLCGCVFVQRKNFATGTV